MEKSLFLTLFALCVGTLSLAQQYKMITVVESIVPGGLGRSRLIETKTDVDINKFTTERTDGKTSKQRNVKRRDAKIDAFSEAKLLNFYSLAGINFQNIASNDALISSKINELVSQGWILNFVVSGVESDAGGGKGGKGGKLLSKLVDNDAKSDGVGIYITRFIFKKQKYE